MEQANGGSSSEEGACSEPTFGPWMEKGNAPDSDDEAIIGEWGREAEEAMHCAMTKGETGSIWPILPWVIFHRC